MSKAHHLNALMSSHHVIEHGGARGWVRRQYIHNHTPRFKHTVANKNNSGTVFFTVNLSQSSQTKHRAQNITNTFGHIMICFALGLFLG